MPNVHFDAGEDSAPRNDSAVSAPSNSAAAAAAAAPYAVSTGVGDDGVDPDEPLPVRCPEPEEPELECSRWPLIALAALLAVALIAIGASLLSVADERANAIATYAAEAKAYEASDMAAVTLWSGTVNNVSVTHLTAVLQAAAGSDVPTATSAYVTAAVPLPLTNGVCNVSLSNGPNFAAAPALTRRRSSDVHCAAAAFVNGTECNATSMAALCGATYGASATFAGVSACESERYCGECVYLQYAAAACFVVRRTSAQGFQWAHDAALQSCAYPFDTASVAYPLSAAPAVLEVTVRASTDPLLVLQRLTQGRLSFAHLPQPDTAGGIATVVIGVLLFVGAVAAAVHTWRRSPFDGMEDVTDD
jgi:hypothetical protein